MLGKFLAKTGRPSDGNKRERDREIGDRLASNSDAIPWNKLEKVAHQCKVSCCYIPCNSIGQVAPPKHR